MRKSNFVLPAVILTGCAVVEASLGYAHSADFGGWWPISLAVTLLMYGLYSVLFAVAAGDCVPPAAYTVCINGVLAAVRVFATYSYYTAPIDWGAVNQGSVQLTFVQSLVHSGWTFYLTPVLFLFAHFIAMRTVRRRVRYAPLADTLSHRLQ